MKAHHLQLMTTQDLVRISIVVGSLLLIPLTGNRFIDGWNWSQTDFIVAGIVLSITGIALTIATKKTVNTTQRLLAYIAVLAAFFWIWIELAVGLFTNWGS